MSDADSSEQVLEAVLRSPSYRVAVGIPQGTVRDAASPDEVVGVIRCGGAVVEVSVREYGRWIELLRTEPAETLEEADRAAGASDRTIERLEAIGLVATFTPGHPLTEQSRSLRPIPLGVGIGNGGEDPYTLVIGDASLTPVLGTSSLEFALWWQFDGLTTLGEACATAARELAVDPSSMERVATGLIRELMSRRLILLDLPRTR
jgi:hypothetical protein